MKIMDDIASPWINFITSFGIPYALGLEIDYVHNCMFSWKYNNEIIDFVHHESFYGYTHP